MVRTSYLPLAEPTPPREVMYLYELTALDEHAATFTGRHGSEVRMPVKEWVHLQRPGHLGGRFVATPAP